TKTLRTSYQIFGLPKVHVHCSTHDARKQKAGTVSDIAYEVGFESLSYFTKMFQEEFDITPSEYLTRQ
ncbi:MAG: AraC family transcriptional regulator, partial [Sphingobacteriaceae bacterium]